MGIDVNLALFVIAGILAFAIIRTFINERHARKNDVDYVCGFVGERNTPEEAMRLREEARHHMEQMGFHFDYTSADAKNETRRQQREQEREALKIRFLAQWEEEKANRERQKEVLVPIETLRRERMVQDTPAVTRTRGIDVLYPRNSKKRNPQPPPPKGRKRFRKRDGTSTYQLGLDVSPVYGIKNTPSAPDKTMQNSYKPFKEWHRELEEELAHLLPDDYPENPEEAFESAMREKDDDRIARQKEEILNRPYTAKDYKENLNAYDEIRKKLLA